MTTPSYPELVAAVRREGEAMVSASRQSLDADVPSCSGWTVSDLARHVAGVYTYVGTIVHGRLTTSPSDVELPEGDTASDVLAEALEDLVDALRSCDADTPMWNWTAAEQVACFWARRMTHESTVHRFDAQLAHGVAQPIDADLAHDGIDELLDVIYPAVLQQRPRSLPTATYAFSATDEGLWCLQVDAHGVHRLDTLKEPDVTVRGTASALLLAACNRVAWTSLDVDGDAAALDAWSASLSF